MPVTVRFDPTSNSKQAQIILDASPLNDGVMTAEQAAKLAAIPDPLVTGLLDWAMFYGLTAGTGNGGSTDYAGTIAARTSAGTGHVPFPRSGPAMAGTGITPSTAGKFILAAIGTYEVNFRCHTTEPGQLELVVNDVLLPETCMGNANPTSGGHPIGGSVLITTTVVDSVLEVVNPNGNSPALTITPADGASTHAQAQVLSIKRLS